MRITIMGARGIPARYSGYDTLAEELALRLAAAGHRVRVYCRRGWYRQRPRRWRGVELVHLPAPRLKGGESLVHSFLSTLHFLFTGGGGVVYFLDPANAPFVCLLRLRGLKVVVHTDGLGWKRRKWGRLARRYYRWAEGVCARRASALVADNPVMVEYYQKVYGAETVEIAYGARVGGGAERDAPAAYGLERGRYLLLVARLEPENNTDLIIAGHAAAGTGLPLLVVGSAPYARAYHRRLRQLAGPEVVFAGRVEDQARLRGLYQGCLLYLHGHEVGGTNPSLLRAMEAGAPIAALDVDFNRAVLQECGWYFARRPGALADLLLRLLARPEEMKERGARARSRAAAHYRWEQVSRAHEELFRELGG